MEQVRKQSRKSRVIAPLPKVNFYQSLKKQVDKELLGLMVLRWNRSGPIRSTSRKKTKKLVSAKQVSLKERFRAVMPHLIAFLHKMNRCKIKNDEILHSWHKIDVKQPYHNEGSFYFLRAAKFGCLQTIQGMFTKYGKYFVFDFDHIGRTALHIVAANGNWDLAKILIEKGADYEASDYLKRKPLHYAIQNNHFKIVRLLVKNRCNPFSECGVNYQKLTTNKSMQEFLQLA